MELALQGLTLPEKKGYLPFTFTVLHVCYLTGPRGANYNVAFVCMYAVLHAVDDMQRCETPSRHALGPCPMHAINDMSTHC